MRRKITALFSFFILIFSISLSAYATTPTQHIEYFSDGSYIVTEITKTASKSGNTAKASATGVHYVNGQSVESVTRIVTLTCSATGNFS